jgi:hypothetical protein
MVMYGLRYHNQMFYAKFTMRILKKSQKLELFCWAIHKQFVHKHVLSALILASLLLSSFASAAITPSEVQVEFKRWNSEIDTILQAQPKTSELRKNLHIWFTDQGRSLSKVKEPILSASLPSKMWGSSAYLLDSANQHASELNNIEYRSLLTLSLRVMEYCHKAYAPKQTVCTDDHYWNLQASIAIYLAKLSEPGSTQQLASIPALVSGSMLPVQGFYAKSIEEMATDECSGWTRLLARHLTDDYFPRAESSINESFVNAYFDTAQNVLNVCEKNNADMQKSAGYVTELAVNSVSIAKPFGKDTQAKALPFAERAYKAVLNEFPSGDVNSARPSDLMRLLVLASALGKTAETTRWATALPSSLRNDNSKNSDGFACNFFISNTRDMGDSWKSAIAPFPAVANDLQSICPRLSEL